MTRLTLMKCHTLLAAYTLPAAILFLITGALYTWGVKGSYNNEIHDVPLSQPLQAELSTLTDLALAELKKRDTSAPEGQPKLKVYGDHFLLEWTGSSKDVILEPTADSQVAKLTVKNTTWYRSLVQLHKAKGGTVFKVYAAAFAIALAVLLLSGFIMAWQTPKLRRMTLTASLAGLGSFLIVVYLS